MNIDLSKGVGPWLFGMTKGQVIDLFHEPCSVEKIKIENKNYNFGFDEIGHLNSITIKGKAEVEINGIKLGSSIKDASEAFASKPFFSGDNWAIIFNNMENIHFDVGPAKMELLYETGAAEDGELDEQCHETKKLKIKSITIKNTASAHGEL